MPEEEKDEGKIILQVRSMHCQYCRYKVYKAIIGYAGVEDVSIDLINNKVTLKAPKVDAKKLFESVKKKSGGKVIAILHPDPNKQPPEAKGEEKKPVEVTLVLKVSMDCASCKRKVEKAAWSIKVIHSVKVAGDILTVKGMDLDAKKICADIKRKTRKHTEVVPPKKDDETKDGDKKDDEMKDGDKKEGEKKDDAKKDLEPEPQIVIGYVYPPLYFSDENPDACVLM